MNHVVAQPGFVSRSGLRHLARCAVIVVLVISGSTGCRKGVILRGDWALELNRTAHLATGRTFQHGDQCQDGSCGGGAGGGPVDDGSWPAVPFRHPRFHPVPLAPVYGEYLTPQQVQQAPQAVPARAPAPMPPLDIYIDPAPQPAELPAPRGYKEPHSSARGSHTVPRAAENLRRTGREPVGRAVSYEEEITSPAPAPMQPTNAPRPNTFQRASTPAAVNDPPAPRAVTPAPASPSPTPAGDGWVRPQVRRSTA